VSRKWDCRDRKYQDSRETRLGDSVRGRGTCTSQLDKSRAADYCCRVPLVSAICVVIYFVVSVVLVNRRAGSVVSIVTELSVGRQGRESRQGQKFFFSHSSLTLETARPFIQCVLNTFPRSCMAWAWTGHSPSSSSDGLSVPPHCHTCFILPRDKLIVSLPYIWGHAVAQLFEVLRYEPLR
jgi:hypothetical protein